MYGEWVGDIWGYDLWNYMPKLFFFSAILQFTEQIKIVNSMRGIIV